MHARPSTHTPPHTHPHPVHVHTCRHAHVYMQIHMARTNVCASSYGTHNVSRLTAPPTPPHPHTHTHPCLLQEAVRGTKRRLAMTMPGPLAAQPVEVDIPPGVDTGDQVRWGGRVQLGQEGCIWTQGNRYGGMCMVSRAAVCAWQVVSRGAVCVRVCVYVCACTCTRAHMLVSTGTRGMRAACILHVQLYTSLAHPPSLRAHPLTHSPTRPPPGGGPAEPWSRSWSWPTAAQDTYDYPY